MVSDLGRDSGRGRAVALSEMDPMERNWTSGYVHVEIYAYEFEYIRDCNAAD